MHTVRLGADEGIAAWPPINRSAQVGAVTIFAVRGSSRRPISEARLTIESMVPRRLRLVWSRPGHLDPCSRCPLNVQTHEERKSSQTRSGILPPGSAPGRRLGRRYTSARAPSRSTNTSSVVIRPAAAAMPRKQYPKAQAGRRRTSGSARSITKPGATCLRISRTPKRPSPCRNPITPHDGPGSRSAPARMGEARCQHVQREQKECLVSGSKWQARQQLEHLDGSHAQRNAGHDADIVDQPRTETAIAFVARALPGALDVCPYCFDEPPDVAAEQSLHRRKRCPLPRGLGPAMTGFSCSAEQAQACGRASRRTGRAAATLAGRPPDRSWSRSPEPPSRQAAASGFADTSARRVRAR